MTQWQIDDLGALVRKGINLGGYHPFTQFMTISKWITTEDLNLFTVFNENHNSESLEEDPTIGHYQQTYEFDIHRFISSKKMVMDFFCKEFTKKDINNASDYYYSAYYANLVLTMPEQALVDGLIYHSVADDMEGYNFALPRKALSKLKFDSAEYCYTVNSKNMQGLNEQKILVVPVSKGTLENGKLVWVDR